MNISGFWFSDNKGNQTGYWVFEVVSNSRFSVLCGYSLSSERTPCKRGSRANSSFRESRGEAAVNCPYVYSEISSVPSSELSSASPWRQPTTAPSHFSHLVSQPHVWFSIHICFYSSLSWEAAFASSKANYGLSCLPCSILWIILLDEAVHWLRMAQGLTVLQHDRWARNWLCCSLKGADRACKS